MRLLIVLVVVFGLFIATCQSSGDTTYKFSIAMHCPSKELGLWRATIWNIYSDSTYPLAEAGGTTSDKFKFIEVEGFLTKKPNSLRLSSYSNCNSEPEFPEDVGIPVQYDEGHHYGFRVYNMENIKDLTDSAAYEYLFMMYLGKDCLMNGCKESSRDYVAKGCDFFKNEASQCMKGYDDALPKYCQKDGSSAHSLCSEYISTTSSTKMILIIGGAVGAIIILVLAIAIFFYCRKKKKSKQNMTGTMSGSGTISGTTKQSTATNNFNTGAPTGTPTGAPIPTGAEATAGAQRY
ncbi:hypothetical protein GCK72_011522 [Caenorhabditis remanei]|uniref:Uncharacterized protein n=1 Tax=Caenorhabditis remanei TaxID=31234 RepID=A0A6A5H8P6_CAERE|nr:hypothetical protein GCK72_011522 [Caenorhabditis remanei]KAF1763256.1 hypothetical protein GCK72_011522 [Caenorhabditis remanei]